MGRLIRRVARGKLLDPIPQEDYKQLRAATFSRPDNAYFIRDLCTRGVILTFTTANYAKCFIILHMLLNDGPIDFIKQVGIQRKTGGLDQTPLDPKSTAESQALAISDKSSARLFGPYFAYLRMRLTLQETFGSDFLRRKLDNQSVTLDTLMKKNSSDSLPPKYVEVVSSLLDMTNTILKVAPCPDVLYPVLSRDLTVLFSLLNDGLISILSVFTSLDLSEAAHGLLIYKSFVALNVTSQTSQYLNMSVPQIDESLTKTMESWLRSEQVSRTVSLPVSPPESRAESVSGSPKSTKSAQIISTISHRQFQRNPASAGLQEPTSVSLSPPKSEYSARTSSLRSHRKNDTAISFDFSEPAVTQKKSRFIEQPDSDDEEEQHSTPTFPICRTKLSDSTITRFLSRDSDESTNNNETDKDSSSATSASTTTAGSPTFVITSTPPKSLRDSDELLECFNDPECEPSPKMSLRKMRPPQLNLSQDMDYDDNVGIAFLKSASSDSSDWSEIFSPLENESKVSLTFTPSTAPSSPPASNISSMGLAVGYPETTTSAGSTYSQKRWKKLFSRN